MAILLGFKPVVLNAYAALVGEKPGYTALQEHLAFISTQGIGFTGYNAALESFFGSTSNAVLATSMLTNLGLTASFTQAQGEAFLAANAGNRVGAIIDLAQQLYSYAGTNAGLIAAQAAYAGKVDASNVYSSNANNLNGEALGAAAVGQTISLTTAFDSLIGTAFNDSFVARTVGNANTLNDRDTLDGGAGVDTVYADFTAFSSAITPVFKNIENVVIRAQTTTNDFTNTNNQNFNTVQIDAQRSLAVDVADKVTAATGVTRWENNNSRSDVIVEDVRIGNAQKTAAVTIAMVETDPGNVDFGVYFDQFSLRNATSSTSSLNLQLLDTRSQAAGTGPLKDNPYDSFAFFLNGEAIIIKSAAIDNALTYADLLTAIQNAIVAARATTPALATVNASLGTSFNAFDTVTGTQVQGTNIVLTDSAGGTVTLHPTVGWATATGTVPASSGLHTVIAPSASSTIAELVTSTVVLDDVGRGSTGGDLVIGGMSVGQTSTSRGVERFEITVGDNSKLQTINSTNNALREVTIVSGATSKTVADAYTTTVTNEGNLTVNGTNFGTDTTITVPDNNLAGVNAYSRVGNLGGVADVRHAGNGAAGFTDVRLIDASAFKGKFAFTAAVSSDAIPKYITAVDTAANPASDVAGTGNVNFDVKGANFAYTGGNDNDTMVVTIDGVVAGSRSTVVAGQSDFTFALNGGEGDDAITLNMITTPLLAGGAQAWYNNQQLNANVTISGGDGNDTIRTPGAGDVKIDAGAGNDVVYTDNTGVLSTGVANGAASAAALAYANAAAAELAAGQAANVASNTTGFVRVSGTEAAGSAYVTTAAAANALNTLNLATPVTYDAATAPTYAALQAQINTAVANGGLSFEQAIALTTAYQTETTAGVVTPAATLIDQVWTHGTVHAAGVISATDFANGNTLLDTYIAAANTAAANALSADRLIANTAAYNASAVAPAAGELLNATQQAVVVATQAMNNVFDPIGVGSGINVVISGYTEGVTPVAAVAETQLVTLVGNASGAVSFLGTPVAASAVADTAAQTATKIAAGSAAIIAAWNAVPANAAQQIATITQAAVADAFVTVTFTGPMGNAATLAASATSAGIVFGAGAEVIQGSLGVVGVTESYTATITGTAAAGETITVDGAATGAFVGNETPAAIATAIQGAINAVAGSFSALAPVGNVITVTGTAANTAIAGTVNSGNFASNVSIPVLSGTQTKVNNLATLNAALVTGATDQQVVTALQTAIDNGSVTPGEAAAVFAQAVAVPGAGGVSAAELLNAQAVLVPLQTTAANLNTAAQATLTAALAADVAAVNTASASAAADAILGNGLADDALTVIDETFAGSKDAIGSTETTAAVTAAKAALTAANAVAVTGLTATTTAATNLNTLKAAISAGTSDLGVVTATANAVANGSITAADKIAIDAAATAVTGVVGVAVTAAEKIAVDALITTKQVNNNILLAAATSDAVNLQAIIDATTTADTIAKAAANSGGVSAIVAAPKAVFVFNTSNQGSTYNRATMDDRNLADLRSDLSNSNNFFNSTVKVSYKGIDASTVVAGTGYKTSDLEINQAIKQLINTDAVLKTLLLATDGPANTLVVTSLIDGVHATTALGVTVTLPTTVGTADLAAAAAAYGLAAGSTEAQVLAAETAAKTAFDAKGDYVTQFAESGAVGGNVTLTGGNSLSSSDNTITGGTGNDVVVLGTTVGTDAMTSSNEKVVFSGSFGNDTVVNFAATGLGIDTLDFSALNGRGSAFGSFVTDKSIVVGAPVATPAAALTAVQIAALFTDSATAINHVYVAVDSTNIGSIWQVADAAGVAATGVVATLVGTVDLADTAWSTLTAANFA